MSIEQKSTSDNSEPKSLHDDVSWGPWLFRLTLAGTLFFMWWLVIYDHGVLAHH